ncbi:MAG: hypothetical protein OSA42_08290, partial [Porticoccaceae bacterium]|nr:hypothetical protein [Porticoccaceae bacterium]
MNAPFPIYHSCWLRGIAVYKFLTIVLLSIMLSGCLASAIGTATDTVVEVAKVPGKLADAAIAVVKLPIKIADTVVEVAAVPVKIADAVINVVKIPGTVVDVVTNVSTTASGAVVEQTICKLGAEVS